MPKFSVPISRPSSKTLGSMRPFTTLTVEAPSAEEAAAIGLQRAHMEYGSRALIAVETHLIKLTEEKAPSTID